MATAESVRTVGGFSVRRESSDKENYMDMEDLEVHKKRNRLCMAQMMTHVLKADQLIWDEVSVFS